MGNEFSYITKSYNMFGKLQFIKLSCIACARSNFSNQQMARRCILGFPNDISLMSVLLNIKQNIIVYANIGDVMSINIYYLIKIMADTGRNCVYVNRCSIILLKIFYLSNTSVVCNRLSLLTFIWFNYLVTAFSSF